jgi:ATP-dependent DNA ligase
MPAVSLTIGRIPVQAAMLDGELVALLRDDGMSSFPGLQTALKLAVTTSCSSTCSIFSIWTDGTCAPIEPHGVV